MSARESKEIVTRFIETINAGQPDALDQVAAPDFVWHGTIDQSLASYKHDLSEVFTAFADAHWTIEDLLAEGNKAVVRWTFRGTQTTGKQVTYGGISICRVAESQVREVWNVENLLGLYRQLGYKVIPPPADRPGLLRRLAAKLIPSKKESDE